MNKITVEVAYAVPKKQRIISLNVTTGLTLFEVIQLSGILKEFPEIDLNKQKIGVFGSLRALTELVKNGDRIEIYRPLTIDPKEARRNRAKKT